MGILQARILQWVAMPSSMGSSQPRDQTQATLEMDSLSSELPGKSKNTGLGSLSLLQGNLPDPEIKPGSPALQVGSLPLSHKGSPQYIHTIVAQLVKNLSAMRETWV